jgi:hypothetical protein
MSQVREPDFDRVVALVLRIGAFGCFFYYVGRADRRAVRRRSHSCGH